MNRPHPTVHDPSGYRLPEIQRKPLRWALYFGYAALTAGIFHGLAQALSFAQVDILPYFPALKSYYQGLTVHGVTNAFVFTFSFSNGFLPLMTARALSQRMSTALLWAGFVLLAAGNVLVAYAVTTNQASVLYTAYAPLQAHWTFYAGLALIVVSTWFALANMLIALHRWRRIHRGVRIPLLAHVSVATYLMWFLASLPITISFVGLMIPWSLGWLDTIDPLLTRTLYWFTGHAILYAWLLPAYVSWFALVPRQVGGKIISDSLVRIVFVLFLVVTIPTGFVHQYADPGISTSLKVMHAVLTLVIVIPSLATAYVVGTALVLGGRASGARGRFAWIARLRWKDPSLLAQVLAMITFVFGGITGLIIAGLATNQTVHNTTWIPGHFHMTIGSAVALTLIGVAYWLIPYLTGRKLWGKRVALVSSWVYTVGVFVFAQGMMMAGARGMPRRIYRVRAAYSVDAWDLGGVLAGVGGSIMFVGILLFFLVVVMTVFAGRIDTAPPDIPWSESIAPPSRRGWAVRLDSFGLWAVVAIVLILIAYGPFFSGYLPPTMDSPGFKIW